MNGIFPGPKNQKVTIVAVIGPEGAFLRSVERGRPLIMSRDAQKMKRVIDQIKELDGKVPRTTRVQSDAAKITAAVKKRVLDNLSCPPQLPSGPNC